MGEFGTEEQLLLKTQAERTNGQKSIKEVKEFICPLGTTEALDIDILDKAGLLITCNGWAKKEEYEQDGGTKIWYHRRKQRIEEVDDEVFESLEPVKTQLRSMLASRDFVDLLLEKDRQRPPQERDKRLIRLSEAEIGRFISPETDPKTKHRLLMILNYGFDPALISPVMRQFQVESPLSPVLSTFLVSDQEALGRLEAIALKRSQILAIPNEKKGEKQKIGEEILVFEESLKDYCSHRLGGKVEAELEAFYKARHSGSSDFFLDLSRSTATCYFQRDFTSELDMGNSHEGLKNFKFKADVWDEDKPYPSYNSIADGLLDYARAVEQSAYPIWLLERGKKLYQQLFPGIYHDLPVKFYIETVHKQKRDVDDSSARKTGAWYDNENRIIYIKATYPPNADLEKAMHEDVPGVLSHESMPRKVNDLLAFIHEYTHALFLDLEGKNHPDVMKKRKGLKEEEPKREYYQTADAVFNEGWGVMQETIAGYLIRQNPEKFGFTQEEARASALEKKGRYLNYLTLEREEFGDGFGDETKAKGTRIMQAVFKRGLGKRGYDQISYGIDAMHDLVKRLNPEKTYQESRDGKRCSELLTNLDRLDYFCVQPSG